MTDQPDVTDGSMTDGGSRVEAVAAVVHHLHHPADPNAGVVRARAGKHAVPTAVVATALTVLGVVLLALAIGGSR